MENTIKGTVKFIGETVQVSEKFKKREIWIETNDQYPQTVSLEAHQDLGGANGPIRKQTKQGFSIL
jgi:hypothetical protein